MTELISLSQANHLMIAFMIIAPIIGTIWGLVEKKAIRGLIYGLIVGVGNFILWNVYNAITDRLGLDTVKNLLVNLALFIVLGVVAGVLLRRFNAPSALKDSSETVK